MKYSRSGHKFKDFAIVKLLRININQIFCGFNNTTKLLWTLVFKSLLVCTCFLLLLYGSEDLWSLVIYIDQCCHGL